MPRANSLLAGVLAACATTACSTAAPRSPAPVPPVAAVHYDVHVASTAPWVLDVDMRITGSAGRLVAQDAPLAVQSVRVEGQGDGRLPERTGARWPIDCPAGCTVHYRFDLSEAASASHDDPAIAVRSGRDIVAPASTWLLRPEPMTSHVPLEISVHPPPGVHFASGFATRCWSAAPLGAPAPSPCASEATFRLQSQELPTAGYTAFGGFAPLRARVHGGVVDIAVLDGERAVDDATVVGWVSRMAHTLDHLFGRFPVPRVQLFVIPEPGTDEATWGRTLPSGGLSVLVTVGARARREELDRDWILVHEMIHLGVPSFWREGRWLDEGLATYFEPVIRTRDRLRSELDLWTEFATQMPRGLGAPGDPALAQATRGSRIYWGGAMFALRADTLIRERTGGTRSLDDGLRAALARGGDATRIWTLDAYLATIDDAVQVPVMRELYAQVAAAQVPACNVALPPFLAPAAPKDAPPAPLTMSLLPPAALRCSSPEAEALAGLLTDLGIARTPDGTIALTDEAPLSSIRRAIIH